jgi:hypothetical protein
MGALAVALAAVACEKVPLLAPTGSTITLTSSTNAMPTNATADLVAQVLEPSGTPPHSGTLITFTTTLGSIEPAEARTDVGGRVVVRFRSGTVNGTATITAISGGATTGTNGAVRIAVGTAAVGRITMNPNPATVPNTGGSSTIAAQVVDINGNALSNAAVAFATTAGTLSASLVTTDVNGIAATVLTTSQEAVVTGTVGAQGGSTTTPPPANGGGTGGTGTNTSTGQASASVTIRVSAAPTILITPPTTPPSVGLPSSYTIAVTPAAANGSAVRDVRVNWGDGTSMSLGALSGSTTVSHVYTDDGTYIISASVTDAAGNTNTATTAVTVIAAPNPTIIVTPSPQSAPGGSQITFTINIQAPTGVSIQNVVIDFDDGTSQSLGGFSGVLTVTHSYPAGVRTYNVRVAATDSTGRTTIGTAVVSITT